MTDTRTSPEPVRISEARDGERPYVIHPEDDDLFVRTGKQVIEACRLGISLQLWVEEFKAMLRHVSDWAGDRADKVRACCCAPHGASVTFFVAPRSEQFDFDLSDAMTELNAELVQRFNVGPVELHQVPWDEMDRFLDIRMARVVYGEAPSPVET
ncbi:MAG TPA: hypothetical protein VM487_17770 [Phycisphaerae bacterium]|nr:hypothetical protein [Phycisphaerae bacterium]